jgi:hypothetical protein
MIGKAITWFAGAAIRRWILGGVVTLLLGTGAVMWHKHKDGLRDEGRFECVQTINEQTVLDLQEAVKKERQATAALVALVQRANAAEIDARARLRKSETRLTELNKSMKEQKENDKEYAQWSDTALPSGVASRLRQVRPGSNTHPSNEDGN